MDRSFPGKEGAVGHCCGWVGRLVAGRAEEEAREVGRATPGREGFVNHAKGSLVPP